jgi:plasmid stabilization system protein ParE
MKYPVRITPIALEDAEEFYLWMSQDSPVNGANWFNGLLAAIDTLASMPHRCAIAPEKEIVGQEIRYLLVSNEATNQLSVKANKKFTYSKLSSNLEQEPQPPHRLRGEG